MLKCLNFDHFIARMLSYNMTNSRFLCPFFYLARLLSRLLGPSSRIQNTYISKYRGNFQLCLTIFGISYERLFHVNTSLLPKTCLALQLIAFGRHILSNRNQNGFVFVIDIREHLRSLTYCTAYRRPP